MNEATGQAPSRLTQGLLQPGLFAFSRIAAATLLLLSAQAGAVGLGRLTVQSALGETLKAEIDVTSLSAEEASTLKVKVASPDAYRATGVEYNSVLTGTQVQVSRRDGRTYLRVSSDRAVQEPFVDVILELNWATGRLVREYTLLFDPPVNAPRPGAAPAPVAPAVIAAAPQPSGAVSDAVAVPTPSASSTIAPRPSPAPSPATPAATRAKAEAKPEPKPRAEAPQSASEYRVKPGDVLYRIAAKTQPQGVSLDQMLVGLYRSNPEAFVDGNMNRLKVGAVMQVPSSDSLSDLSTAQARQVIRAQSTDFNAYRQQLGTAAPALQQEQNERAAKGQVQAAVDDKKASAAAKPDKLTLSKAASAAEAQSAANAKLAQASKETEKKDASARMAELTRNVEELKKLSSAAKPAPATAPAASTAPAMPAAPAVVAAPVPAAPQASAAPAVAAAEPASKPASAARPVLAAASAASMPAMPAPVSSPAEPSFLEDLLESPLVLPIAGALVAALGAFGLYRLRGRKAASKPDTGFQESRAQPDSFFGASGGARVDTREATGSSMNYSLSQLDAIGDVDPVAEADVYLAYGRDLQAEEILKEALRANPERLAIRLKLLEVYAKRRDTKGFEQLAIQLFAETHGLGDDWAKAQELGRQIDPDNPLYQPGGAPTQTDDGRDIHPEPMDASTMPHTVSAAAHLATAPLASSAAADSGPMSGFDLDLDLDLGGPSAAPASAMAATQAMATSVEQAPLSMDFDLSDPEPTTVQSDGKADLEFDLDLPDLGEHASAPASAPAAPATDGALDFDMSSIDLSLDDSKPAAIPAAESSSLDDDLPADFAAMLNQPGEVVEAAEAPQEPVAHVIEELPDDDGDPLMRQLELADEFRQIGDTEGAREVLQELIGKASGLLKEKAQSMLNELR
ncbi:FimV/HubP family polar landmark protein [Paucibacter sp. KCTC 42545]|uniref:FimV/HubP family polar landmark protein n=1 Tax=Paucibacter sp. KCTC 42545 TaxID=1768242 RepID=UPI0009EB2172|nr:FimV/HubP family polar landmark protein [Paucibacter sp. KCTC 42545]